MRNERGVTLIELILVIIILAIVSVAVGNLFFYGFRASIVSDLRREALAGNRVAIDRMVREIRGIRDKNSVIFADANNFEFNNLDGNIVRFQIAGTDLQRVFTVTNPPTTAVTNTLAGNVTNFTLAYFNDAGGAAAPDVAPAATDIWRVRIDLTTDQNGETVALQTDVHPRNFSDSAFFFWEED